jgi:hypothetical protein
MINAFFVFLESSVMMAGSRCKLNKISPPAQQNKWNMGYNSGIEGLWNLAIFLIRNP